MTYRVSGFFRKDGIEKDFSRKFKSEQASLDYFTDKRDNVEWDDLALTWENEEEILAEEIGHNGRLR